MQLDTEIRLLGINPYVMVSAEQAGAIKPGWRRPMPVLVQLNGLPQEPWHINMMPAGDGAFYLYLDGQLRHQAGVDVGDQVTVTLSFDQNYRAGPQHEMHPTFAAALEENPRLKARWEAMTPSLQKEVLRYLAGLKTEAARARNIEQALRVLGGAKARFLGRDWN